MRLLVASRLRSDHCALVAAYPRQATATFADGVREATHDAAHKVLKGMRDYVDATTVLARAY